MRDCSHDFKADRILFKHVYIVSFHQIRVFVCPAASTLIQHIAFISTFRERRLLDMTGGEDGDPRGVRDRIWSFKK